MTAKTLSGLIKITLPLLILSIIGLISISLLSGSSKEPFSYGVTFSQKYSEELGLNWKEVYIKMLDDLNVQNLRLVAYWDDIEKTPGVYNFSDLDFMLGEADKRDLNIILAIGQKLPRWPECFEPSWVKEKGREYTKNRLLILIPKEIEHFKKYESIKYWQVENEPFFPFGTCQPFADQAVVRQEVSLVRAMDPRPILVSDSGEGGAWVQASSMADYLAISMYRKVWLSFWGYFDWPFPPFFYKLKAAFLGIPFDKVINTELQAEPWSNKPIIQETEEELNKTMSHDQFLKNLDYAKKTRIQNHYLWGVEWWYYKKLNGDSFYWNEAKNLF